MGRSYQEIGLKPEARVFLAMNVRYINDVVCASHGSGVYKKQDAVVYESVDSFWGAGPDLKEYTLNDGSKLREVIQLEPWSSGPMAFFCLEDSAGKRLFEWTNHEVCMVEKGLVDDNWHIAGESASHKKVQVGVNNNV